MDKVKTFLVDLFYENNEASLTRVLLMLAFLFSLALMAIGLFWKAELIDKIVDVVKYILGFVLGAKTADRIVNNVVAQFKGSPADQMPNMKKNGSDVA